MANVVAQGASPYVEWDDGSAGPSDGDWRMRLVSGILAVSRYNGTSGTHDGKFNFADTQNTSLVDFRILGSAPTLLLEDNDSSAYDYRFKVDSDDFTIDRYNGTAWSTDFKIADTGIAYVANALAAGSLVASSGSPTVNFPIRWTWHTGTCNTSGTTNITLPYSNKVIGFTCMVQEGGSSGTYNAVCWQYNPSSGAPGDYRFTAVATRNAGSDVITITDQSTPPKSYDDCVYYVVVFYAA